MEQVALPIRHRHTPVNGSGALSGQLPGRRFAAAFQAVTAVRTATPLPSSRRHDPDGSAKAAEAGCWVIASTHGEG